MKFNKNLLSFCFFSALFALSPIATDSGYSEECTLEQNNVFSFHDRGPHEQNSYSSSSKSFKGYSGWQGPLRVNLDYSGGQWIGHDGGFTSH